MACGGRLKLSDFWLNHKDASLFAKSQWHVHHYVHLAWRVFLALYLLGWLVGRLAISKHIGAFFIFLTDWTFTVFTFYAVSSCIGATYFTFADRRNRFYSTNAESHQTQVSDHDPRCPNSSQPTADQLPSPVPSEQPPEPTRTRLPHYFKLVWLLFNICLAVNPIITVVFWSFLSPPQQSPLSWALNIHFHALNTVFIYIDLLLSAIPVRVVHYIYACLYGSVYIGFTLIYYWAGGVNPLTGDTAIYPRVLDWSEPGWTVLRVVLIYVAVLVTHLAGYGGYRLRIFIHKRYFEAQLEESCVLTTAEETLTI